MKILIKICGVLLVMVFTACEKETIESTQYSESASDEKTALKFDFKAERKTLIANEWSKRADLEPRYAHTSLVFDDKMWIIGGKGDGEIPKNDVRYSYNGISWHTATASADFPARFGHASAVFQGKMWVVGGRMYDPDDHDEMWDPKHDHDVQDDVYSELNDVWSSSDGKTWDLVTTNANFTPRNNHTLTSFDGWLWLIGGTSNDQSGAICCGYSDVWKSDNGSDWEKVYDFGFSSSRLAHAAIAVSKDIVIIGGENHSGSGSIRHTQDGYIWSTAVSAPIFGNRFGHGLVHDGEYLWLTEGSAGSTHEKADNDLWYTKNGTQWFQAGVTKQFPTRKYHTSVFFKNRIWVINGKGQPKKGQVVGAALSDIWSLEAPGCCEIDDITFGSIED